MTEKKTSPVNQDRKSELVFTKKELPTVIDQHCHCCFWLYFDDWNNRHLRFQKNLTCSYGSPVWLRIRCLCHIKEVKVTNGLFASLYPGCN